jgi:hypothetical protein
MPQVTNTLLEAVQTNHCAPAPGKASILTHYPGLPTVSERWSQEGISPEDYGLYGRALETIHGLGRESLLVSFWLNLFPLINLAWAGWPLNRLLSALAKQANPLVWLVLGKPLNATVGIASAAFCLTGAALGLARVALNSNKGILI